MASRLGVVFRPLVRLGSFPAFWRQANDTPIPEGPPSSSVANYRSISITSERLVLVCPLEFLECRGVLIGKVLVPVMHFCVYPIHCKVHWRVGR